MKKSSKTFVDKDPIKSLNLPMRIEGQEAFRETPFSIALRDKKTKSRQMIGLEDKYNFKIGMSDLEFVYLREDGKIIFTKSPDGYFIIAQGLNFTIYNSVGNPPMPVFTTRVAGVTHKDGSISRQVTLQQLAAYNNVNGTTFSSDLIRSKEYDEYAMAVHVSVHTRNGSPMQKKKIGYLPRQLPRILTIMKEWYNIEYTAEVEKIKTNLTRGGKQMAFPCSASIILRPRINIIKAPAVRSLNVSGMSMNQLRSTLTKKPER